MRHAGTATLDELEPFLARLRTVPGIVERKRGIFHRRSRAFLHFHEDPSGLYADVRLDAEFERFPVTTPAERERLFELLQGAQQHDR